MNGRWAYKYSNFVDKISNDYYQKYIIKSKEKYMLYAPTELLFGYLDRKCSNIINIKELYGRTYFTFERPIIRNVPLKSAASIFDSLNANKKACIIVGNQIIPVSYNFISQLKKEINKN